MREISSAERARCLAQVAEALAHVHGIVERMRGNFENQGEWAELIDRIEAARQLTTSLRVNSERRMTPPFHPL